MNLKKMVVAVTVLAALASLSFAAGMKAHPSVKQDDVKWAQPFGPEGPTIGVVLGQFGNNKPASFFVKFKAGQASAWHFHNHDYEGVTIKGTFTEQQQGGEVVQLPVGTWFTQPAKQVHQNTCLKGTEDCLLLVHFDKGADSVLTDETGKPLPPPAKAAADKMDTADKKGM